MIDTVKLSVNCIDLFIMNPKHFIKIIPIVFLVSIISFCAEVDEKPSSHQTVEVEKDSTITVSISVVGDIMCHSTQYGYAWVEQDSFDFKPVYREIRDYLASPDITMGNLETVLAGKGMGYSGYPLFNSPDQFLDGLSFAGFDLLFTSNNHVLDQGQEGLIRTLDLIESKGMVYVGANRNKDESELIRIIENNGVKLAVLAYTYGTNGIRLKRSQKYLVNKIDTTRIKSDILIAKKIHPDLVIVYFHFGKEYERKPTKYQKRIVDFTIKNGADIILGSHTHTLQPVEMFKTSGGNLDSGFVAYSLGNFISNQRWRYSNGSAILNFSISKNINNGKIELEELSFLPYWVFKGKTERGKEFIILPSELAVLDSLPAYITPKDKKLMKQSYFDTKEIVEWSTDRLKIRKLR